MRSGALTAKKEAVLRTLIGIAKTHKKFYAYATRETICGLVKRFHYLNVAPRTLSRYLSELDADGWLVVVHRNWSEVNGSKKYRCNLYKFTKKLFLWLKKLGEYARKVFSHFRVPTLAPYSFKPLTRDLKVVPGNVEILWKTEGKGRASPIEGVL
jgi:hypothetical protein